MREVLSSILKYGLASVVVMLLTLSVSTGHFPPPVLDIYKSVKAVNRDLDLGGSMSVMAKAQTDREKILSEIDQVQQEPLNGVSLPAPVPNRLQEAEKKIQALEYEVARLKSRLRRAESEANQLREQVPPLPSETSL